MSIPKLPDSVLMNLGELNEMEPEHRRRLDGVNHVLAFLLAGNSVVTLQSRKTGKHFTFNIVKITSPKVGERMAFFLKVLTRPDRYDVMGFISNEMQIIPTFRYSLKTPSVRAFVWAWQKLYYERIMPAELEVWHEGRCGRCGRRLTVPESIERGIGPECIGKMEGM